ncbi:MAG: endoxylanase [Verrucomicrobia bacterium]|nr:endoxylanase [Verrucomicrobiota bacterium]
MDKEKEKKAYCIRRFEGCMALERGLEGGPLPSENWGQADKLSDFSFPWLAREEPSTIFRALWDDDLFYFRFEVTDPDVVLGAGENTMEKVIGSDRVEIFFTTGDKLNPYYGLEMDPRGEVLAYETRYPRQFNWEWTCPGLEVWPQLTEDGYDLEGVIPLETFRKLDCLHQQAGKPYLKAGLFRAEFSHGVGDDAVIEDWISWIDPGGEVPDFHVPSAFGILSFEE